MMGDLKCAIYTSREMETYLPQGFSNYPTTVKPLFKIT